MPTALEEELAVRLHRAADSIASTPRPVLARPSRHRRRWWVAAGLGAGVLIGGGVAVAELSTPPELEKTREMVEYISEDAPGSMCGEISETAEWRQVARQVLPAGDSIELWVIESSRGYYATVRDLDANGTFVGGGGTCSAPTSDEGTITALGGGDVGTSGYRLEVFGQVDPAARSARFTLAGTGFTAPVGEEGWFIRRVEPVDVGGQLLIDVPTDVEPVP